MRQVSFAARCLLVLEKYSSTHPLTSNIKIISISRETNRECEPILFYHSSAKKKIESEKRNPSFSSLDCSTRLYFSRFSSQHLRLCWVMCYSILIPSVNIFFYLTTVRYPMFQMTLDHVIRYRQWA